MRINNVFTCGYRPAENNADIVSRWSQRATASNHSAKKVCNAVLSAIDHLHQPGAALHQLDLSGAGLTTLPPAVIWQRLEGLTILDVSNNELPGSELESISSLTSLRYLYLSNNPLRQIPSTLLECEDNLAILDADNCLLEQLPEEIMKLNQLDTLLLRGNPLQSLPDTIGYYLCSLSRLDIKDTKITTLPKSLNYLEYLKIER